MMSLHRCMRQNKKYHRRQSKLFLPTNYKETCLPKESYNNICQQFTYTSFLHLLLLVHLLSYGDCCVAGYSFSSCKNYAKIANCNKAQWSSSEVLCWYWLITPCYGLRWQIFEDTVLLRLMWTVKYFFWFFPSQPLTISIFFVLLAFNLSVRWASEAHHILTYAPLHICTWCKNNKKKVGIPLKIYDVHITSVVNKRNHFIFTLSLYY